MKRLGLICAISLTFAVSACSDPQKAYKALDSAGFTGIKTLGFQWFKSCGRDYSFLTGFEATNPHGKKVSGFVCTGWLAGSTIKFD